MSENTYQMDLSRLWTRVIQQAEEDLTNCPDNLHAECLRVDAQDFLQSPLAETAYSVAYPDDGESRLRYMRDHGKELCKHALAKQQLRKILGG